MEAIPPPKKPDTGRLLYAGREVATGTFRFLNNKRTMLISNGYDKTLFKLTY